MFASLATVYNVLNLFAEVGLVRSFTVEGGKTIFDTNTTDHCHFISRTVVACLIFRQARLASATGSRPPRAMKW